MSYDPELDLAVVYVPDLTGPLLDFSAVTARTGADAIVLGYPLDGDFDAQSARIRDTGPIRGPDIYGNATVTREVYTMRGLVRSGNSGGPLLDADGAVLGVIFAAAADNHDIGFALTLPEVTKVADPGPLGHHPGEHRRLRRGLSRRVGQRLRTSLDFGPRRGRASAGRQLGHLDQAGTVAPVDQQPRPGGSGRGRTSPTSAPSSRSPDSTRPGVPTSRSRCSIGS